MRLQKDEVGDNQLVVFLLGCVIYVEIDLTLYFLSYS